MTWGLAPIDPAERRAGRLASIAMWTIAYLPFLVGPANAGLPRLWIVAQLLLAIALAMVLVDGMLRVARTPAVRRTIILVSLVLVLALVKSSIDQLIDGNAHLSIGTRSLKQDSWAEFFGTLAMSTVAYALNFIFASLAIGRVRIGARERELAEARTQAAQAQLAMLRYQLNPHFLFNTLNAISTLVVTGRAAAAEEMLSRLSAFLRASLASDPGEFVTLDAELDVIQEYLEIESVRFGERLRTDFAIDSRAVGMAIPSFLLQPLVENSIKYAVSPSRRPVLIKVEGRLDGHDLVVTVADDGDAAADGSPGASTGVGLRNIRERLDGIYEGRASLEAVALEKGFLAIIRLPARLLEAPARPALAEAAE